jgi:cation:H+ antiporter
MWEYSIAIIAGFALLVWGADKFVIGASGIARNLGVSPLIIGLTIVGFGTSAPEILISAIAAWNGNPGLAIGNAIGSNITNIALILGVTAVVVPLSVHSGLLRREYPLLLAVTLLVLLLLLDNRLTVLDGVILLVTLAIALYWMVMMGLRARKTDPIKKEYEQELEQEIPKDLTTLKASLLFIFGLALLLISSRMLVWGAVHVAQHFGISDLVIGLTIVALGTSLPELAASVMSAIRKEHDIAIGNVIGSNMFNLLAVMGLPGLITPGAIPANVLTRDFPVMLMLTLALYVMSYGFKGPGRINRLEGTALLAVFCGYQYYLFTTTIMRG